MVVPPLGSGGSSARPWCPAGIPPRPSGVALGGLLMLLGSSAEVLALFSLGISIIPLSLALVANRLRVPGRVLWTTVGVVLAAYWLMPPSMHDGLFGKMAGDIEMFVVSGIMIVISFTLIIVFNARVLTSLFTQKGEGAKAYVVAGLVAATALATAVGGYALRYSGDGLGQLLYLAAGLLVPVALTAGASAKFPALAPALKMAIAYPLSNRFRTGMTIAMFSLIVFSLTVFSVLVANFDTAFLGGDARANMDVVTTSSGANPINDVPETLSLAGSVASDGIAGSGRTTIASAPSKVSQPGKDNDGVYRVVAADDGFFGSLGTTLDAYANGYASEQAAMDAVRGKLGPGTRRYIRHRRCLGMGRRRGNRHG